MAILKDGYEYLGDFAVAEQRGVSMNCDACRVNWVGCAAYAECPRCGSLQAWWVELDELVRKRTAGPDQLLLHRKVGADWRLCGASQRLCELFEQVALLVGLACWSVRLSTDGKFTPTYYCSSASGDIWRVTAKDPQ